MQQQQHKSVHGHSEPPLTWPTNGSHPVRHTHSVRRWQIAVMLTVNSGCVAWPASKAAPQLERQNWAKNCQLICEYIWYMLYKVQWLTSQTAAIICSNPGNRQNRQLLTAITLSSTYLPGLKRQKAYQHCEIACTENIHLIFIQNHTCLLNILQQ